MKTNRLEAFSDGVFAIIITIMVLELKVPHDPDINALRPLLPIFLTYLLSFIYLGIYWNNHHHLLNVCRQVSGGIMWANLHLLFWLSLFPFVTGWMGENHFQSIPSALYGGVLLMAALAYYICKRSSFGCMVAIPNWPAPSAPISKANFPRCFTPSRSASRFSNHGSPAAFTSASL